MLKKDVCFYCNMRLDNHGGKTIDHIIPKSLGGKDKRNNYVICCKECNLLKGNLMVQDFLLDIEFYLSNNIEFKNFDRERLGQIRKSLKNLTNRKDKTVFIYQIL